MRLWLVGLEVEFEKLKVEFGKLEVESHQFPVPEIPISSQLPKKVFFNFQLPIIPFFSQLPTSDFEVATGNPGVELLLGLKV